MVSSSQLLIGGRLSIDFVNQLGLTSSFSWEELLRFLLLTRIISSERSSQLLDLPQNDLQSARTLHGKAQSLHLSLRDSFRALIGKEAVRREWVESINGVLRITEGHDELLLRGDVWGMEFIAREGGLDWLLAAVARSGAELIAEGPRVPLRVCSNPSCGLFFYDASRTHLRRWCSMARCGNRHKVALFTRRHSSNRRVH